MGTAKIERQEMKYTRLVCRIAEFCRRSSLVIATWLIGVSAVLQGCDGVLSVKGTLEPIEAYADSDCEISLWKSTDGFWWREPASHKLQSERIRGRFDCHWVISGPAGLRWLEVSCPGYEVFRSKKFEAPSIDNQQDLGAVILYPRMRNQSEGMK